MAQLKRVGTTGNVGGIQITANNANEVLYSLDNAVERALTKIGIRAEKFAKARCPVGTEESTGIKGYRGGTLRNSITFQVNEDEVAIGSNVEYAPYVELGTGTFYDSPPAWIQHKGQKGSGLVKGMKPRPFLRPAIEDHLDNYLQIVKNELKNA